MVSTRTWLVCLLSLSACEEKARPRLTIEGLDAKVVEATFRVPVELEVRFRSEAGALTEPQTLLEADRAFKATVAGNNGDPVTITRTVLEPGRHRLSISVNRVELPLSFDVQAKACDDCEWAVSETVTLVAKAPTQTVTAWDGAHVLHLVPGETRAVHAFASGKGIALNNNWFDYPTGAPLDVTSSHPSVATVDGGLVLALSPGVSSITFSALRPDGTRAEALVGIEVMAGDAGIPREGSRRLFPVETSDPIGGGFEDFPNQWSALAVDSRGAPVAVTIPPHALGMLQLARRPALLAQWTGTGFETWPIGRSTDDVYEPQLTIDERDVRYVAFANRQDSASSDSSTHERVVVAELRPHASAVTYRVLERTLGHWLTIAPRSGGGCWVAFLLPARLNAEGTACTASLRLSEITDGTVRTQDVAVFTSLRGQLSTDCASPFAENLENPYPAIALDVTRRPTELPDVALVVGSTLSARYFESNGSWQREALPSSVGARSVFPPLPSDTGATPAWTYRNGMSGDRFRSLFVLQVGAVTWKGLGTPGLLERGLYLDDPSPRFLPVTPNTQSWETARNNHFVQGVASRAGRLHFALWSNRTVLHAVADAPQIATASAPESSGRALRDDDLPANVLTTPSGLRFRFTRTREELALARAGDAPFTPLATPDAGLQLVWTHEHGGQQWFAQLNRTTLTLFSTDGGSSVSTSPSVLLPENEVVLRGTGGAVFVQTVANNDRTRLFRFDLTAPGTPHTEVTPDGGMNDTTLVAATDGVAVFARQSPTSVRLRRWSTAGALVEDVVLPLVDPGTAERLDTELALVEANGRVTVPSTLGSQRRLYRREAGEPGFVLRNSLPGTLRPPVVFGQLGAVGPVQRLSSGALLLPIITSSARDCAQLRLLTSTDEGFTFSMTPPLRPWGGCKQTIGPTTEVNGTLVITLTDNQAMRAFTGELFSGSGTTLLPPQVPVLLTVPVP